MAFSKQAYNSVKRVLQNRTLKVSLNSTWREIHDEMGIGQITGKYLFLSSDDHTNLRQYFIDESGADPLNDTIKGDRLEVASKVRFEKWATESVFSGLIQVNVLDGTVPLLQGDANTPSGTLLGVSHKDIDISRLERIVLVENGIVALNWHRCQVPNVLNSALMVYRGHNSRAVSKWLSTLPSTIHKVGYFDFDPAGIGIAIDNQVNSLVVPELIDDTLIEGINNNQELHIKQLNKRPELGKKIPASYQSIWDWMIAKDHQCAITQERLTVMNRKLSMVDFM